MSNFSLNGIRGWLGQAPGEDMPIASFSIDSRSIEPGAIYVAIRGATHDGHAFIKDAVAKGASACIVDAFQEGVLVPQIVVQDTLVALQDCAREYRKILAIPVIGITGSNGKTTTKNFVAAILSKKYKTAYTKGSFNNHIGLPLSLLSIKADDQAAVMELGTNHKGEIKALLGLARPTHAIITNIGVAHIEHFGSSDAIANEKGDLARFIGPEGIVVTPKDGRYFEYFTTITKARVIGVSPLGPDAAEFGQKINPEMLLPQHMVLDALLAREIGKELGVKEGDMVDAIISMPREEGRFIQKKVGKYDIIDDTYNGNPDSVCAAMDALGAMYGSRRKIVALGALGELGDHAEAGYRRILESANSVGVSLLVMVNIPFLNDASAAAAFGNVEAIHVKNNAECTDLIKKSWIEGDIILLKGSKSAVMKEVIASLQD